MIDVVPAAATVVARPIFTPSIAADVHEILSLVGDGVVSVDRDGNVILFNRAAEELFGYTSDEMLGRPLDQLIPSRFHERHRLDVDRFCAHDNAVRRTMGNGREVLGQHKDGREFAIEATLSRQTFGGQPTFTTVIRDVTDRRTSELQRQLVADEVAHRLRNMMAVVNSILQLTARAAPSVTKFKDTLAGRFAAIARTNETLIAGMGAGADFRDLLMLELAAYANTTGRVVLTGPDVGLDPKRAFDLALVLHELATNAAKYGALAVATGTVSVGWRVSEGERPVLELIWQESGSPAVLMPPRRGFGSQLIARSLRSHGGTTESTYPEDGMRCVITLPLVS